MTERKAMAIAKFLGVMIRVVVGSVAFGIWQQSNAAGIFAGVLLITLEPEQ